MVLIHEGYKVVVLSNWKSGGWGTGCWREVARNSARVFSAFHASWYLSQFGLTPPTVWWICMTEIWTSVDFNIENELGGGGCGSCPAGWDDGFASWGGVWLGWWAGGGGGWLEAGTPGFTPPEPILGFLVEFVSEASGAEAINGFVGRSKISVCNFQKPGGLWVSGMATYSDQIAQKGHPSGWLVVEKEPGCLGQQVWTLQLGKLFEPLYWRWCQGRSWDWQSACWVYWEAQQEHVEWGDFELRQWVALDLVQGRVRSPYPRDWLPLLDENALVFLGLWAGFWVVANGDLACLLGLWIFRASSLGISPVASKTGSLNWVLSCWSVSGHMLQWKNMTTYHAWRPRSLWKIQLSCPWAILGA